MSAASTMRHGFTLPELLVVLAAGGIIIAVLLGLLAAQVRLARDVARRTAAADAVRVSNGVLAGELRRMAAQDLRALATDSMAIRAFRGAAVPCARAGADLIVRYRGERLPDPRKDSVLVIDASAAERTARLTDVRSAPAQSCSAGDGEVVATLSLAPSPDSAALLLLFEPGSYHLSRRALRYRLGAEGRQPITAELLVQPPTRFVAAAAAGVSLVLAADTARTRTWFLSFGVARP
jgi:prepilin-type N-terminal cleavage/methylation domain-containing protein